MQHYTSPFPRVAHWASLWGWPQRWHAKGVCATWKEKEKRPCSICSFASVSMANYAARHLQLYPSPPVKQAQYHLLMLHMHLWSSHPILNYTVPFLAVIIKCTPSYRKHGYPGTYRSANQHPQPCLPRISKLCPCLLANLQNTCGHVSNSCLCQQAG